MEIGKDTNERSIQVAVSLQRIPGLGDHPFLMMGHPISATVGNVITVCVQMEIVEETPYQVCILSLATTIETKRTERPRGTGGWLISTRRPTSPVTPTGQQQQAQLSHRLVAEVIVRFIVVTVMFAKTRWIHPYPQPLS